MSGENLLAAIAASKSKLYLARTFLLCSAAVDVNSNMNSVGFGVLHLVDEMSFRICIRLEGQSAVVSCCSFVTALCWIIVDWCASSGLTVARERFKLPWCVKVG